MPGEGDADDGTPGQQAAQIFMPPEHKAGVWANFAQVSQSAYEFTFDFVRLDFSVSPPDGIVVARVSMSPLFISQFLDALQQTWDRYADVSGEVHGGQFEDSQGEDEGEAKD